MTLLELLLISFPSMNTNNFYGLLNRWEETKIVSPLSKVKNIVISIASEGIIKE